MSLVEEIGTQTLEQLKGQDWGRDINIHLLLFASNYPLSSGKLFLKDPSFRRGVMVGMQTELFFAKDPFSDRHVNAVGVLAIGHTIEASDERSAQFLQESIATMMKRTLHQPTFSHVTPRVTELLEDGEAVEYLGRMLTPPNRPLNGWLPAPCDKPIIDAWQERFDDPDIQLRLDAYRRYLADHEARRQWQTNPIISTVAVSHER